MSKGKDENISAFSGQFTKLNEIHPEGQYHYYYCKRCYQASSSTSDKVQKIIGRQESFQAHLKTCPYQNNNISDTILRPSFYDMKTIVIKIGTEVVHDIDGFLSLSRLGGTVQQICRLHRMGKKVILVTSGAVGIGKTVLRRQQMLSTSIKSHLHKNVHVSSLDPKACAAAGQSGMQSLYETLFSQYDVACCQILISDTDFGRESTCRQLRTTICHLLSTGIIPILNENDVISQRSEPLTDDQNRLAWDNDSLAAHVASIMQVDALMIMTDMSKFGRQSDDNDCIRLTSCLSLLVFDSESRVGEMGQKEKFKSVKKALEGGRVQAVVVADAGVTNSICHVMDGKPHGTVFLPSKL